MTHSLFNRCSSYGDSVGSRPVCGSDGRDYPNMCELHKSSCLANRMIDVKFQGACGKYYRGTQKHVNILQRVVPRTVASCDTALTRLLHLPLCSSLAYYKNKKQL